MPTLVAELGVPLWATGQALGSHCSSRGAEKPPFPRKIEIWRDIGGGSHYFRRPQSYPITRPPPPSSLVQKKPRPDQVTFSVFAPSCLVLGSSPAPTSFESLRENLAESPTRKRAQDGRPTRRGRVSEPCGSRSSRDNRHSRRPTTSCVWRSLPYLTLPYHTSPVRAWLLFTFLPTYRT